MTLSQSSAVDATLAWGFTELIWIRHGPELYTVTCSSILGLCLEARTAAAIRVSVTLWGPEGTALWEDVWIPHEQAFHWVDSRDLAAATGQTTLDAVLALRLEVAADCEADFRDAASRLYSLVDWIEPEQLHGLHSDQLEHPRGKPCYLTEVVLLETEETQHELVYLTGAQGIAAGAIALTLRNDAGETRVVSLKDAVGPWRVLRLRLRDLLPALVDFAASGPVVVEGQQGLARHFVRPYVMATGRLPTLYHGGDRYPGAPIPAIMYKFLGRGRGNPAYVKQTAELRTVVNLLHSHGALDADFDVDAWLYDDAGALVCHRPHWLRTRRHHVTRGQIADLLPPEQQANFSGHIRLHFSPADGVSGYPATLQMLMEYAGSTAVSRVMLWSDLWNTEDRVALQDGSYHGSWYRIWANDRLRSSLAASNCSIWDGYTEIVRARLVVHALDGRTREHAVIIPPHGTAVMTPADIWPDLLEFLGHDGLGWAEVLAPLDLAKMHFTHHLGSNQLQFEHCMPMAYRRKSKRATPPGS